MSELKPCPFCNGNASLVSTKKLSYKAWVVTCDKCGHTVYNDINICVLYCAHAEECVGTELYNKLVRYRDTDGVPPEKG